MSQNNLCALVIGHTRESQGARNAAQGLTEFEFNEDLAKRIKDLVNEAGIEIVYRNTYKSLPADINALDPGFIVSLHCNAFNTEASGTEVLYYYRSEKGRKIAQILFGRLHNFLQLNYRGIKPKSTEDRGGYLLRYTNAPCVIAEPFFIDNDSDLARAQADIDGLARVYAEAIDEMVGVVT